MFVKIINELLGLIWDDLLEAVHSTKNDSAQFHGQFHPSTIKNKNSIASGDNSNVTNDRSDPHMVRKYNKNPMDDAADGFEAFINYLIDHDLMDNIHFPQVYEVKHLDDTTGTHVNKFQIEKLIKLESLSREELVALTNSHFNPELVTADPFFIATTVSDAVTYPAQLNMKVKMESLKEALQIISDIRKEERRHLDIHANNLMVRRTPYGPQLVIADPFTYKSAYG